MPARLSVNEIAAKLQTLIDNGYGHIPFVIEDPMADSYYVTDVGFKSGDASNYHESCVEYHDRFAVIVDD